MGWIAFVSRKQLEATITVEDKDRQLIYDMIHNVKYFGRQLLKQLQPTQPPTVSRTKMSTGQSAVILCS